MPGQNLNLSRPKSRVKTVDNTRLINEIGTEALILLGKEYKQHSEYIEGNVTSRPVPYRERETDGKP